MRFKWSPAHYRRMSRQQEGGGDVPFSILEGAEYRLQDWYGAYAAKDLLLVENYTPGVRARQIQSGSPYGYTHKALYFSKDVINGNKIRLTWGGTWTSSPSATGVFGMYIVDEQIDLSNQPATGWGGGTTGTILFGKTAGSFDSTDTTSTFGASQFTSPIVTIRFDMNCGWIAGMSLYVTSFQILDSSDNLLYDVNIDLIPIAGGTVGNSAWGDLIVGSYQYDQSSFNNPMTSTEYVQSSFDNTP